MATTFLFLSITYLVLLLGAIMLYLMVIMSLTVSYHREGMSWRDSISQAWEFLS